MSGRFYPDDPQALRQLVDGMLSDAAASAHPAGGGVVPHAGLVYSGACAAHVFTRVSFSPLVIILAPNHTGVCAAPGGASAWCRGAFRTPLGDVPVAEDLAGAVCDSCLLVEDDPTAHATEHAVEVELPFLQRVAPTAAIVPIVLAWDDWDRCRTLADALASLIAAWPEPVTILASSDMTHYESAAAAEAKDRVALDRMMALDGEGLLDACARERITMCGRAPTATALATWRALGHERADIVDYRHSGAVTGDHAHVVAYAGAVIT